jgi:multiple sugar transport system substrate-binding protein
MTRRRLLQASGVGALGGAGAVVLAACGETQIVTKEVPVETTVIKEVPVERIVTQTQIKEVPVERVVIKEVPVEKIVTKEVPVERVVIKEVVVEKIVEVAPQAQTVALTFATDHTSGPRGAAVKWAVEAFAGKRPDIRVLVEPVGGTYWDTLSIRAAAGTLPEMVLWDGHLFNAWRGSDVVLQLNDILAKMDGWNAEEYYYIPNLWTDNGQADDHTFPPPTQLWGDQYGITYQGGINGMIYNQTLVEELGTAHPDETWTWDDLLENAQRATDPETGTWGMDAGGNWFSWHPLIWSGNQEFFRSPDDTKFTLYDNGGIDGFNFIHDAVFEQEVAAPLTELSEIRGEFSSPFTAGVQAYFLTERVRQTARPLSQIKDRFEWSLAPVPVNPTSGKSGTFWSCQFHAVTNGAAARGNVEQTAALALFFGTDVQHRVAGIDRGHLSMWRPALETPSAQAGPPNNMQLLKSYADGTENRHRQYRMPNWGEWYQSWIGLEQKAMLGDATVEETVEEVKRAAEQNQATQIDEMVSRGWI